MKCPKKDKLWDIELVDGFQNVSNDTSSEEMNFEFRILIPLPLFLTRMFLDSGVISPSELGFLAVASGKAFLEENKDLENVSSIKDALGDVLSFLWAASKNQIPATPCVILNKREVVLWSLKLHEMSMRLTLTLLQDYFESNVSLQVLSTVTDFMIGLRIALED